jgi:general secretion pathway protein K
MAARAAQIITAETAADSAIRLTLLQINAPVEEASQLAFSAHWQLELFDRAVDIRVEREAGRVDLNATDTSLLSAVFIAGGIDTGQAHSFASRIVDWRDIDNQPGPGGAELGDYKRAKIAYGPRNGPFESIGELRQVLGLADLSPQILDAFTMYSTRSPTIALEFAHPIVKAALTLSSQRAPELPEPLPMRPNTRALSTQLLTGQVVRIHACLQNGATTTCRAAIVRLTGNGQRPFLTYAWYTE